MPQSSGPKKKCWFGEKPVAVSLAGGGGDSLPPRPEPHAGLGSAPELGGSSPRGAAVAGRWACYQHRPHTRAQRGGARGASHGAHPWQEDALGSVHPSQGQGGLPGGREALTSRKEQLAMSKMMQPRDQTSDFWLKEKLRASGAIQDFWKGSVGRSEADHA